MLVDAETLKQVAALINASPIKVRLSHVELDGVSDDIGHRVAFIENARVVGSAVRADIRFLSPTDAAAQRIMAIVETDPTAIGLSINTAGFKVHPPDMALRVKTLDAVDLVSTPAANPAGMLSAKPQGFLTMNNLPRCKSLAWKKAPTPRRFTTLWTTSKRR